MSIRIVAIGPSSGSPDVGALLDAVRAEGHEGVAFTGRAVLGDPGLLAHVQRARALGFQDVQARAALRDALAPEVVGRLADAGLTLLEAQLLTHDAVAHDGAVRRPGALASALEGLREALARGVRLRVRVLVSPLFVRDPAGFAGWLATSLPGLERVALALLAPSDARGLVAPGDLRASLAAFLRVAFERGLSVRIVSDSGIPCCLFHDAPAYLDWFHRGATDEVGGGERRQPRTRTCLGCALEQSWCPGLHDAYGRLLGGDVVDRRILRAFPAVPDGVPEWRAGEPGEDGTLRAVGRFDRLRAIVPFRRYLGALWDAEPWREPRPDPVYVTPADLEALAIRGEDAPPVLLVRSPCFEPANDVDHFAMPPLALFVLGNMLTAHGYRVSLRDLATLLRRTPHFGPDDVATLGDGPRLAAHLDGGPDPSLEALFARVAARLDPPQGALVAVSVQSAEDVSFVVLLARHLRRSAAVRVVLGGRIQGVAAEILRRYPEIDWIVRGEGEVPLLLLAATLHGRFAEARVPNLLWRDAAGTVRHNPLAIPSLDLVPTPRPLDLDLGLYDKRAVHGVHAPYPYFFVKGCPFHCAFCGSHSYGTYRIREPRLVVRDLTLLSQDHGLRNFYFLNTLLNVRKDYLEELLVALEAARLDIAWTDCCRPGNIALDVFPRLRAVGCANLTWGVDAPSNRLQRLMRKNVDVEASVGILAAAHRAGIENTVNVIIGLPHETEADRDTTRAYLDRIRPFVARLEVHPFRYLYTSRLFLHPDEFGLVPHGEGCDEVGGLTWEEKRPITEAFGREVVRDYRPTGQIRESSSGKP